MLDITMVLIVRDSNATRPRSAVEWVGVESCSLDGSGSMELALKCGCTTNARVWAQCERHNFATAVFAQWPLL